MIGTAHEKTLGIGIHQYQRVHMLTRELVILSARDELCDR